METVFPETSFNLGLFLAGRITTKTTAAEPSDPKKRESARRDEHGRAPCCGRPPLYVEGTRWGCARRALNVFA